jgi:hypothetical protein
MRKAGTPLVMWHPVVIWHVPGWPRGDFTYSGVACTGAETAGHPLPGQGVEVEQVYPPVTTTLGYTGNFATGIDASLIWSRGTISVLVPVATLTSYGVKAAIPTSVTVPCSGSGVMSFAPSPDPDNSGTASDVSVTFASLGA